MTTGIVWFKNDLRLHDNETLFTAIKENEQIVPLYCIDDTHFADTTFGIKKMGSIRAQFLLESLHDLHKNLSAIGSGLVVVKGNPAVEIVKIAELYQANTVYAKYEIANEEIQTENEVAAALQAKGIGLQTYATSTLYNEYDMPFDIQQLPDVFTAFRNKLEKSFVIRDEFTAPLQIKSPILPALELPTLASLGLADITTDKRSVLIFTGGETAANNRLHHYFYETKSLSIYKETRNGLIGANYSSKFSAWLAMGCISPVSIYHQVKKYEAMYEANQSTYWLIFELLWRDYFYFVMQKFGNKLFLKAGIKNNKLLQTKYHPKYFMQWVNGQTGVPFVDANMIELKLTGFMSNRGRQNVASYLCNDMKIDWRYGASYFEHQLIDYDVASNWGNWAYIAGVGNDPRPNRYFNIAKQANDYDANGAYRKLWLS